MKITEELQNKLYKNFEPGVLIAYITPLFWFLSGLTGGVLLLPAFLFFFYSIYLFYNAAIELYYSKRYIHSFVYIVLLLQQIGITALLIYGYSMAFCFSFSGR